MCTLCRLTKSLVIILTSADVAAHGRPPSGSHTHGIAKRGEERRGTERCTPSRMRGRRLDRDRVERQVAAARTGRRSRACSCMMTPRQSPTGRVEAEELPRDRRQPIRVELRPEGDHSCCDRRGSPRRASEQAAGTCATLPFRRTGSPSFCQACHVGRAGFRSLPTCQRWPEAPDKA